MSHKMSVTDLAIGCMIIPLINADYNVLSNHAGSKTFTGHAFMKSLDILFWGSTGDYSHLYGNVENAHK